MDTFYINVATYINPNNYKQELGMLEDLVETLIFKYPGNKRTALESTIIDSYFIEPNSIAFERRFSLIESLMFVYNYQATYPMKLNNPEQDIKELLSSYEATFEQPVNDDIATDIKKIVLTQFQAKQNAILKILATTPPNGYIQ